MPASLATSADIGALRVPVALRPRVREILAVTDSFCHEHLDHEYGKLCRRLVGRLARKRPSPLERGTPAIWAAGAIYAVGSMNFLLDRSQQPHLTADELATYLDVAKSSMANKAARIRKLLELGIVEPELTRRSVLEQHPLAWLVEINGLIVDARQLPADVRDESRRRRLIPDIDVEPAP